MSLYKEYLGYLSAEDKVRYEDEKTIKIDSNFDILKRMHRAAIKHVELPEDKCVKHMTGMQRIAYDDTPATQVTERDSFEGEELTVITEMGLYLFHSTILYDIKYNGGYTGNACYIYGRAEDKVKEAFMKDFGDIPKKIKIRPLKEDSFTTIDGTKVICTNMPFDVFSKIQTFPNLFFAYEDGGYGFTVATKNMTDLMEQKEKIVNNGLVEPIILLKKNDRIVSNVGCDLSFFLAMFLEIKEIPVIIIEMPEKSNYNLMADHVRKNPDVAKFLEEKCKD